MDKERKKKLSAEKAYEIIKKDLNRDTVLGIGTGTTTNCFIEIINKEKLDVKGAVCSSESSKEFLSSSNIKILSLNDVHQIDFYIDGADEFNSRRELIKGGGGALTKEKILAHSSETFICIVDDSKYSDLLGKFPIPIEVIELARSAISREMMRMGGRPVYRNNFVTDKIQVGIDGPDNFRPPTLDRKSTRLNSSHHSISYAVFCLKKKFTKIFSSRRFFNLDKFSISLATLIVSRFTYKL